ncbi:hypothetical protein QWY14_11380 [Planococcus sp. N028]|uniref:Uncharacterized protein n=1 Tax=Planococcus shixiaomingii TaxID=3058393 RepID=A0ABT8N4C9_9BACL|nr:hypothetical protein [Planococcus sp. N028]MDN7242405.1 hypothetical protein [Planococcus sp. N028]
MNVTLITIENGRKAVLIQHRSLIKFTDDVYKKKDAKRLRNEKGIGYMLLEF